MEGVYCPGPRGESRETCVDTGVREIVTGSVHSGFSMDEDEMMANDVTRY